MVWPTTRSPQGSRYGYTLDRTVLGQFYLGEQKVRNLWRNDPTKIKKTLKLCDHWRSLADDVIDKYARASYDTVRRIVYLWRGIEANLLASNPKLIGRTPCYLHCRLWRWTLSTAIHSYAHCAKSWKLVTLHILHYCNKVSRDNDNPMPKGVPGLSRNGSLDHCWFEMIPALKYFCYAKTLKDFSVVPIAAYDDLAHLIQTRMMPPPPLCDSRFEEEYLEIRRQFTRTSPWTQEMAGRINAAVDRFGNYLANMDIVQRPHISLSGSGCYESSRVEGGRAIYIQKLFIEKYVRVPASASKEALTWWGAPYRLVEGVKPYRTQCRKSLLRKEVDFLHSAFRDEMAPGGLLAAVLSGVNEHLTLEEPMFGLDREFPHQILQLCVEEAVASGYVPGPVTDGPRNVFVQQPIPTEVIFQPEGGNKVRALSETPAVVTVLLQPFAHWLAGLVGKYPTLRSAFSRSYKGWDLAVLLMRRKDNFIEPNSGFSVIDLVGSTNGFHWNLVRRVLTRLVNRFARNRFETFYFTMAINLLLAPRLMKVRRDHRSPEHRVILTERGIHMGDPGAKECLCTIQALMELMVYSDVPRLPPSLIAGDDHGAVRTYDRHRRLIATHIEYGNEIQETKAQFSVHFMTFCEEMLVYVTKAINRGIPPWKLPDDEDHLNIHRDTVKMRLLAPFSSTGEFQISDNPAFGKGSALYDQLLVHKNEERKNFILHTFNNWMASFLREDPLVYLPRCVGGLNVPWPHSWKELADYVIDNVDPILSMVYLTLSKQGDPPLLFHVLTRRMSTGASARGIIDPMTPMATVQYAQIAGSQFQDQSKELDWFLADVQSKKSYPCSYKDALANARRQGYVSYSTIADNLDRMTAMRVSLAAAAGAFPLEDVVQVSRERRPTPKEVLQTFINDELPHSRRLYGADPSDLKPTADSVAELRKWILAGAPNFISTMKKGWVPASAVTDSLNGMTIAMPPKVDAKPVPGSQDDEHFSPQEGYTASVISRKRLRSS